MNARQWKPGDVGIATSGERFLVTRDGHCAWDSIRATDVVSGTPSGGDRPLVVIDPEDREQVESVFRLVLKTLPRVGPTHRDYCDALQAALRSLVTPPRPEEPTGLFAQVEDVNGHLWYRSAEQASVWRRVRINTDGKRYVGCDSDPRKYAEIDVACVLSPGVES